MLVFHVFPKPFFFLIKALTCRNESVRTIKVTLCNELGRRPWLFAGDVSESSLISQRTMHAADADEQKGPRLSQRQAFETLAKTVIRNKVLGT